MMTTHILHFVKQLAIQLMVGMHLVCEGALIVALISFKCKVNLKTWLFPLQNLMQLSRKTAFVLGLKLPKAEMTQD